MSALLSKNQILSLDDLEKEKVETPEWGGHVFIRQMTAMERDNYEAGLTDQSKDNMMSNFRAKLVVRCCVDEKGERLFSDEDAPALGKKCSSVLVRLFNTAERLNALGEDQSEELKGN